MAQKNCPLLLMAGKGAAAAECLGAECAWWVTHENPNSQDCAIKELSDDLKFISLRIAELPSK